MNIYLVYDKKTGDIVQTATFYALGSDDPIACPEDEVLSMVAKDAGRDAAELAVARAPSDFDPRDRTKTLTVDARKGVCIVAERKPSAKTKTKSRGA
jgi:hypothetical protein